MGRKRSNSATRARSEAIYAAFFQPGLPPWSLGDVAPLIAMLISESHCERSAARQVAMDLVASGQAIASQHCREVEQQLPFN